LYTFPVTCYMSHICTNILAIDILPITGILADIHVF
jgi:hypothetical protein